MWSMLASFSILHCKRNDDSKSCRYSAKDTSPLQYKALTFTKGNGSDITLVFGIFSKHWPIIEINSLLYDEDIQIILNIGPLKY